MIDKSMDFFMNWIAGLPIELGRRCDRRLRIVFVLVSLVWVPAMFLLFAPLWILWLVVTVIYGIWEEMSG